jgi:transcriptional regulator with PAS, ATPase and Fis domain
MSIDDQMREMEKSMIEEALRRTDGVQVRAAELLGINQRSLWHRIKKYEIDVTAFKSSRFDD